MEVTFRAAHLVSFILAAGVLALGACALLKSSASSLPGSTVSGPIAEAGSVQAEQDLRSVTTAATAYFADNGAYDGMTADALRSSYDAALPNDAVVVSASGSTFCLQATVQAAPYSERGPGAPVTPGAC